MRNDIYDFRDVFKCFDTSFEWSEFPSDIDSIRKSRKPDKEIVAKESTYYDLSLKSFPDERFFTDIGSAHFECFFHKGSKPGLVVFFNTARTINRRDLQVLPFFTRWSFHNYTEYSCLCIGDPMYYRFDECRIGWYMGTKDQNYRQSTAELIKHIADVLNISNNQIVLYGSSAGGTAAIEIARFIDDCSVVSINPQLNMHEFNYCEGFVEHTGISFFDYEKYNNNYDPVKTLKSISNNVLLLENIRSRSDFNIHLRYLCENLNITPKYGLSQFA